MDKNLRISRILMPMAHSMPTQSDGRIRAASIWIPRKGVDRHSTTNLTQCIRERPGEKVVVEIPMERTCGSAHPPCHPGTQSPFLRKEGT